MFEKAARLKLRFQHKGILSVEDLWDLSLQELDGIYKRLNTELKTLSEESLLEEDANEEREITGLKWSIIKCVFKTKQAEQKEREVKAEKAAKKQRVLEIIVDKQDEQFRRMSIEELNALIAEL